MLLLFKNLPISSRVFFFQEKDDHRGGNSWLREDLAHQGGGLQMYLCETVIVIIVMPWKMELVGVLV